jgi:hypothetical protein
VVPVFIAQLHEKIIFGHTGIGDEHVELTHRFFGARDQSIRLGAVGEIARQNVNAVTEIGGKLIEDFASGARKGDRSALRVQNAGDAAADRASGSRN